LLAFVSFVASQNKIAEWHLDSTKGNIFYDTVSGEYDGVVYGHGANGWYPEGKKNGCFNFGNGDVRGFGPNPVTGLFDFSISFWMYTIAPGNENGTDSQWHMGDGLVDADLPGYHDDFGITLVAQKVAFGYGPTDTSILAKTRVTDAKWHHIVCTRRVLGQNSTIAIYVDGFMENSTTNYGTNFNRRNVPFLSIGAKNTKDRFYAGLLDEVVVYDGALDPQHVQEIYNADLRWVATPSKPTQIMQPEVKVINLTDYNAAAIAIFMGILCFILIAIIIALLLWDFSNKRTGAYITQTDVQ
jgi:hypothetical protein